MVPADQYEDEDEVKAEAENARREYREFDCPSCNANNPCESAIMDGDELLCNYCGSEYRVRITEEGRLKLKER